MESTEPPADTGDESRYMVKTKNGTIDQDTVNKYKEAHTKAMKEQAAGGTPDTGAQVNCISSN